MVREYSFEPDGTVVEITRTRGAGANAQDVLKNVMSRLGQSKEGFRSTPMLPNNCRLFWTEENIENYLIEVKPGIFPFRTSGWENEDYGEREDFQINVAMPWQYFHFQFRRANPNQYGIEASFETLRLYWAFDRIENHHSYVFRPLLPNVDDSSIVCLGEVYPESTKSTVSRIEEVVANFYESDFNGDLGWNIPYSWDSRLEYAIDGTYSQVGEEPEGIWVRETKKSMLCYLDWKPQVASTRLSNYIGTEHDQTTPITDTLDLNTLLYYAVRESRAW